MTGAEYNTSGVLSTRGIGISVSDLGGKSGIITDVVLMVTGNATSWLGELNNRGRGGVVGVHTVFNVLQVYYQINSDCSKYLHYHP